MKLDYPATSRNRKVIESFLANLASPEVKVLELASGSGQHGDYLTEVLHFHSWQPSECDPDGLKSISAYQNNDLPRKTKWLPPTTLDVSQKPWNVGLFDLVFVANLFHISPKNCMESVFNESVKHLSCGGSLVIYGPFIDATVPTSQSNLSFDFSLRQRDEQWGLRDLEDVIKLAEKSGFKLEQRLAVPSNNLIIHFKL